MSNDTNYSSWLNSEEREVADTLIANGFKSGWPFGDDDIGELTSCDRENPHVEINNWSLYNDAGWLIAICEDQVFSLFIADFFSGQWRRDLEYLKATQNLIANVGEKYRGKQLTLF